MAAYSVYFPGARGANPAHFDRVGLHGIADNAQFADVLDRGPDGGGGVLATWQRGDAATDAVLGNHAGLEWREAKPDEARGLAKGRCWFGFDRARRLTPADLERPASQRINGHWRKLADGQQWMIPAAPCLPHTMGLHPETGRFAARVDATFAAFAARANSYAVEMFRALDSVQQLRDVRPDMLEHEGVSVTIEDAWQHACEALAINYRLTPEVIDALDLLDKKAMLNVIMATFDYQDVVECVTLKKKPLAVVTIPVTGVI